MREKKVGKIRRKIKQTSLRKQGKNVRKRKIKNGNAVFHIPGYKRNGDASKKRTK